MEVFLVKLVIAWKASYVTVFISTVVCIMYSMLFPSDRDKKASVVDIVCRFIHAGLFAFFASASYTVILSMVTLFHAN